MSRNKKPFAENCKGLGAGEQGFEPRLTEPESAVLPLHYSPVRLTSKALSTINENKCTTFPFFVNRGGGSFSIVFLGGYRLIELGVRSEE